MFLESAAFPWWNPATGSAPAAEPTSLPGTINITTTRVSAVGPGPSEATPACVENHDTDTILDRLQPRRWLRQLQIYRRSFRMVPTSAPAMTQSFLHLLLQPQQPPQQQPQQQPPQQTSRRASRARRPSPLLWRLPLLMTTGPENLELVHHRGAMQTRQLAPRS